MDLVKNSLARPPVLLNIRRMETTKEVADAIGRSVIAETMGVRNTTVSEAVTHGLFPASWYLALKKLGSDKGVKIPDSLFRFKGTP